MPQELLQRPPRVTNAPLPSVGPSNKFSEFLSGLFDPLAPKSNTGAEGIGALLGALPMVPLRSMGPSAIKKLLESMHRELPSSIAHYLNRYTSESTLGSLKYNREIALDELMNNPAALERIRNQASTLGSEFPVYRGRGWLAQTNKAPVLDEPRSFSLSPLQAKPFSEGSGSSTFTKMRATPESVLLPGNINEMELIIDPAKAKFLHTIGLDWPHGYQGSIGPSLKVLMKAVKGTQR